MEVRSPSRLFEEATVHGIHDRSYDIIVVTSESLRSVPVKKRSLVRTVLDTLGEGSAKAQKLPSVITTMGKVLEANPPQYIYLCVDRTRVLGFLKFGKKHLFITNPDGKWLENDFDCLLDFYVHESCQRQGIGYLLFSNMLLHQELEPRSLAYDRPSSKLIPFLRRHCNLRSFTPQNNNYVVFDSYYKDHSLKSQRPRRYNDSIDHIMNQSSLSGNQSSSVKKYVDSRGVSGRGAGRTRKKDYFTSSSTAQQHTLQQRDIKSTPYSAPITTTSEMDSLSNLIGAHSARRYCSMTESEREHITARSNSAEPFSSSSTSTSASYSQSNYPSTSTSTSYSQNNYPSTINLHNEQTFKDHVLFSNRFDRESNVRRARGGLILG